jgi:hypothetical protein
MTSDKAYDIERRYNALVPALAARVTALEAAADTWHDTGSMTNGWGKGTGYFKYRLLLPGVVIVAAKDLTCTTATVADGTTILTAANGLNPNSYQPAANHIVNAWTDQTRIAVGSNVESCGLKFITDGSVQCLGVGGSATTLNCYGLVFTDI